MQRIVFAEVVRPRKHRADLKRDLEAICLKCLEKNHEDRYATVRELSEDVEHFLAGRPTKARPAHVGKRVVKWTRRRPVLSALVIAITLFVAVSGLMGYFRHRLHQSQFTIAEVGETAARLESEVTRRRLERKRHEYVENVQGAYIAWRDAHVISALALLDRCRPGPGEEDERGFEWYYVRRLCDGGLWRAQGHDGQAIHGCSFSPDGSRLATCGDDGSVHIWEAETGSLLGTFGAGFGQLRDVRFSPDGRFLATVGETQDLKLWDARTYELTRSLRPALANATCLSVSKDGTAIAVAGEGGLISAWHLGDETERVVLSAGCDAIHSLDFATDGKLAAACSDEVVRIWDLTASDVPVRTLKSAGVEDVYSASFSPDSQHLATGGDFVHIWDLGSADPPTWLRGPGHHKVAFSGDGQLLATSGNSESIRIMNVATNSTRHRYHAHTRRVLALAFSSVGNKLASVDKRGTVVLWDASWPQDRRPLPIDPAEGVRLAFSPTDDVLAIAKRGKRDVQLWTAIADGTAELVAEYSANIPYITTPQCMQFSPDGQFLAVATDKDRVVLDADLGVVSTHGFSPQAPLVHALAFSAQGFIAESTDGNEGVVSIVDAKSGRMLTDLSGYRAVSWSPDGSLLATERSGFMLGLWDIARGRTLADLSGHTGQIRSVAFSPDDRMIASGSGYGTVRLWDAASRRQIRAMRGHVGAVLQIAFSPNQKVVVSSGRDGTIRFWDIVTGRRILELRVIPGAAPLGSSISSMSFSGDGQVLATAYLTPEPETTDGHVDLWHAPRGN